MKFCKKAFCLLTTSLRCLLKLLDCFPSIGRFVFPSTGRFVQNFVNHTYIIEREVYQTERFADGCRHVVYAVFAWRYPYGDVGRFGGVHKRM